MLNCKKPTKQNKSQKYFIMASMSTLLAACGTSATTGTSNVTGAITTGNDNVVLGGAGGAGIVDLLAGDDIVVGGDAADFIRGGAGADNIQAGGGVDNIVVIGITSDASYSQSDIDNPNSSGVNLSSLISLMDLNNNPISDLQSGEVIDGGADGAILFVYGKSDFTGVSLSNITRLDVHSEVTIPATMIKFLIDQGIFNSLIGDGSTKIIISNDGSGIVLDFSSINMQGIGHIVVEAGVTLLLDQADLNGTTIIEGAGSIKSTSGELNFDGIKVAKGLTILDDTGAAVDVPRVDVTTGEPVDIGTGGGSGGGAVTTPTAPILHVANEMTVSGVEFKVNTQTAEEDGYSSVTGLSDGGYLVVWQSDIDYGVSGQRYNADGSTNGSEFVVNGSTLKSQGHPDVTSLKDGGFVITWQVHKAGLKLYIYGQKYTADGTKAGDEFQINTEIGNEHYSPGIVGLEDGGFVVVWDASNQGGSGDGGGNGVYGQRYNADGSANGSEFQVNTYTNDNQFIAEVAALNDGGFVITWSSDGQEGQYGVFGQRYNADGSVDGGEFQVNVYTTGRQIDSEITTLNDGGYIISWESQSDVYGQIYNADGSVRKAEFLINTHTSSTQDNPVMTALSDGGFVVVWDSKNQDGVTGQGVYGQRFDAAGTAIDDEFHINTDLTNDHDEIGVAAIESGGFVVSWTSDGGSSIYAQRYEYSETYKLTKDATEDFDIVTLLQSEQDSSVVTMGSVSISGVPSYVSFTKGSSDGNGTWTIAQSDLDGLQIKASNGDTSNFSLTLSVTLTHTSGGTSTSSSTVNVSVGNVITGTTGQDSLTATSAIDHVDGKAEEDTLTITGDKADFSFAIKGNDLQITNGDNVDLIHSIENLTFTGAGGTIDVDTLFDVITSVDEAALDVWLANSYDYNT